MRALLHGLTAAVLAAAGSSPALAQTYLTVPPGLGGSSSCLVDPAGTVVLRCGQTFTVPAGDDFLYSFRFLASTPSTLSFQIFQATTSPSLMIFGAPLYSAEVGPTPGSGLGWVGIAPPSGLDLVSGNLYAAVLAVEPGEEVYLPGNFSNPYAGGQHIGCEQIGAQCGTSPSMDLRLEAVFAPRGFVYSPVPEPATLALFGTGLLALGGAAARRRR
jgi:hypothetical protein